MSEAVANVVSRAAKDSVATTGAPAHADLALSYERHNAVAEQTKAEYSELNRQMVANLSAEHLEPFAKILLERDNCAFKQQQIAESLRQNLLQALDQKLDIFWREFDVANGITSLEMLKEKFRDFEGTDWNLQSKTPQQRTLPTRMRFKEMRLRLLRKQLQSQQAQLEEIKNINGTHRAHIRQVEQQRIILGQQMESCSERFERAKPELLRMLNEAAGDAD